MIKTTKMGGDFRAGQSLVPEKSVSLVEKIS